jgi:hypothetical protein
VPLVPLAAEPGAVERPARIVAIELETEEVLAPADVHGLRDHRRLFEADGRIGIEQVHLLPVRQDALHHVPAVVDRRIRREEPPALIDVEDARR